MTDKMLEIEKTLTFQENSIEQLNETVSALDKRIAELERTVAMLSIRVTDEEFVKPQDEEEPPPHY